jgi:hypothetical protein
LNVCSTFASSVGQNPKGVARLEIETASRGVGSSCHVSTPPGNNLGRRPETKRKSKR